MADGHRSPRSWRLWLVGVIVAAGWGSNAAADEIVGAEVGGADITVSSQRLTGAITDLEGRMLDTRPGGATIDGMFSGIGGTTATTVIRVDIAGRVVLPHDARAVLVNVVAVAPPQAGYLQVFDCDVPRPQTSTLNFAPGETIANTALVGIEGGAVCISSNTAADVVLDLVGSVGFGIGPPARVVDTRIDEGLDELVPRTPTNHTITDGIPGGSVVLNVTATNTAADGWLSVGECAGDAEAQSSTVNFAAGDTVANLVVVHEGFCLLGSTDLDVVIDALAYLPDDGDVFPPDFVRRAESWRPRFDSRLFGGRIFDTRSSTRRSGLTTPVTAGSVTPVPIQKFFGPSNVAIANITVTEPAADGHITAFGCSDDDDPVPGVSSMNYRAGETVAHTTFVAVEPTEFLCVFSLAETHLVIDHPGDVDLEVGFGLRFRNPYACDGGDFAELFDDGEAPRYYIVGAMTPEQIDIEVLGGVPPYQLSIEGTRVFDYDAFDLPGGIVRFTITSPTFVTDPQFLPFPIVIEASDSAGHSITTTSTLIFDESALNIPC